MNHHNKIIFTIIALFLASVAYNYHKIIIKQNYLIVAPLSCDPKTEVCYANRCILDGEEECFNSLPYYKTIQKRAYNIPDCDPNKEECAELSCAPGETDCFVKECQPGEREECYTEKGKAE